MLALRTIVTPSAPAAQSAEPHVNHYTLLRKLEGGLRADVWVGLGAEAVTLDEAVLIKVFFPHAAGAAREGLAEELELARRLSHENIVRSFYVGSEPERPCIVSEYLQGTTLQTLLIRASVAGVRMPEAAVARVLLALVNAIEHADHQTASVAEKALVYQLVAVDDVFVTHDGAVKLLGFKSRLGGNSAAVRSGAPSCRVTADAAIDALLSDHSTTRLRAVLGTANTTRVRPCDRLWHVGQVLKNWQTEELGSDGRAELAAFIGTLLPAVLPERRIQLEAAFEGAVRARHASPPPPTEVANDEAPVSGFRAIQR